MKKVYVFLAEGFEEMEAVTPIDLLRRAGVDAKLVSVTGNRAVTGAHGVTYLADLLFEEIEEDADMLVLPGGLPGTTNLQAHEGLTKLLLKQHEAHKWVAAICAAPMVLGALGIVKDRHATIYPGIEDKRLAQHRLRMRLWWTETSSHPARPEQPSPLRLHWQSF